MPANFMWREWSQRLRRTKLCFLSKLAFQLVSQPNRLWVQDLRAKYNWSHAYNFHARTRHVSHIWRSISKAWDDTEMHITWKPGDGCTIRFWSDAWLDDIRPLKFLAFADISEEDQKKPLQAYVDSSNSWS